MANTVDLVLSVAANEVGYLEKATNNYLDDKKANAGSGNYTKYWRDLKPSFQSQAWCNCFVNWCFVKAFGQADAKKLLYTSGDWSYYTPTSASYFKNNNAWYSKPVAGDIIYFKNSSRIHHVGIVRKVDSNYVYTIEGNTSSGSEIIPNGGGVYYKSYLITNPNIAGYGRPKYDITKSYIEEKISTGRIGLIVTADSLNVRKEPYASSTLITSLNKNDFIYPISKTTIDGVYWFRIENGWVSGKYLQGWIHQLDMWWYLDKNSYPKSTVKLIDDKYYCFDKDGWLITSDRIDSSGAII